MTYLVAAYAKDDSLYPADIRVRAQVDQRLQFDLGTLYQRFGDYYVNHVNKKLDIYNKSITNRS